MQTEGLCKKIRQVCAQRHWFGPDMPWLQPAVKDDPRRFGFVHPPVTETQLLQAEDLLGFSLPLELRALYCQLANGGFGPHYGFCRLIGEPSEIDRTVVEFYQECRNRCAFFDLQDQVQPRKNWTFDDTAWPREMLRLCDEGCGNSICIHTPTRRIFQIGIWDAHQYCLTFVADSLERWLQVWVEMPQSFPKEEHYPPPFPWDGDQ